MSTFQFHCIGEANCTFVLVGCQTRLTNCEQISLPDDFRNDVPLF